MKALIKLRPEKGIWMADVPLPQVGINDVLIKIKKTAICGTDLHIYKWDDWSQRTIQTPMTIGHEYVGEIVDKGRWGKEHTNWRPRDWRRTYCLWALQELPTWKASCV